MKISQIKPQLAANGVNLVAVGLEKIGVKEFMEKKFFDGGTVDRNSAICRMYGASSQFTTEVYIDEIRQCYKDLSYRRYQ